MIPALIAANTTSHQLYPLISDLGLILLTAGFAVLLFKKIKQPLVLGYLVAGFLAGNHFDLFPTIKDMHSVEVWAEIGVIFLLFSLGLEFSFKKLMKVGGTASITATVQILTMIMLGYFSGQLMGWSQMDSIFLGAILSMSSTTIILRAFDELNVKGKKFAGIVFGALIVEDIVAILLMVLLSTIAVSQNFSGSDLLESVIKLGFFLILWFLGGIFLIPTLLKKAKNLLNEETLLIVSLALCLMMVILATKAGFSPALGAFIMGSIIAETTQAEKIEHLIKPVKDLFGAVFFVSVGMLINPYTLVEYAIPVLIITLVTIFGKTFSTCIGALVSGQPLKQSVQAGMSLAQIGEFSFIIATLGMTLNVTSPFLYPIIVAVSAITTFTTPFMIKLSEPMYLKINDKLPIKWKKAIENYSNNSQSIKSTSTWQVFIKSTLINVIINTVIIIAIILISQAYLLPWVSKSNFGNTIAALITLIVIMPFIWALSLKRVGGKAFDQLREERKYRGAIVMIILGRIFLALFFIGFLLNIFFSPLVSFIALLAVIAFYTVMPKRLNKQYARIENHFLKNFNDREIAASGTKIITENDCKITPWDGHMATFTINSNSSLTGKTLFDLKLRELLGINIASIKRGELTIHIPQRNEIIFPGDLINVIGSDEQILDFKNYLDHQEITIPEHSQNKEIVLRKYNLSQQDYIGKTIRESKLRELTGGLIVGIERDGNRILNPESEIQLLNDDIVWIVGDKKLLDLHLE
ncbi:MAG: cation:proton antiporter [Flavobacterium sp.]|nr:cation:proton antiporter [Candidatus Neoflavobacterium equi]